MRTARRRYRGRRHRKCRRGTAIAKASTPSAMARRGNPRRTPIPCLLQQTKPDLLSERWVSADTVSRRTTKIAKHIPRKCGLSAQSAREVRNPCTTFCHGQPETAWESPFWTRQGDSQAIATEPSAGELKLRLWACRAALNNAALQDSPRIKEQIRNAGSKPDMTTTGIGGICRRDADGNKRIAMSTCSFSSPHSGYRCAAAM